MNSGQTSTRVYDALRQQVATRAYRPGARLDPQALADAFGSSVTPVRDALHILIGEGLVETGPGEGFHVPQLDEQALKDLYDWNKDLLLAALRRQSRTPVADSGPSLEDNAATQAAMLFATIARRSGNRVHALALRWANARLHPIRLVEIEILPNAEEEVSAMAEALAASDKDALRKHVGSYHRRRKQVAAKLVRALHQVDADVPIL